MTLAAIGSAPWCTLDSLVSGTNRLGTGWSRPHRDWSPTSASCCDGGSTSRFGTPTEIDSVHVEAIHAC